MISTRRCPWCGGKMKAVVIGVDDYLRCLQAGCKHTRPALTLGEFEKAYAAMSQFMDGEGITVGHIYLP